MWGRNNIWDIRTNEPTKSQRWGRNNIRDIRTNEPTKYTLALYMD